MTEPCQSPVLGSVGSDMMFYNIFLTQVDRKARLSSASPSKKQAGEKGELLSLFLQSCASLTLLVPHFLTKSSLWVCLVGVMCQSNGPLQTSSLRCIRVCVCVCKTERGRMREKDCACMLERGRECVCVFMYMYVVV